MKSIVNTNQKNIKIKLLMLLFIMASTFIISIAFGAAKIPFKQVLDFILFNSNSDQALILKEIRIPRVIASGLAGMALSLSGTYMQGMTRNPLASPSLFGLTAGASAAVATGIAIFKNSDYLFIIFLSFLGCFLAGGFVFLISFKKEKQMSPEKMILAGAAVSTLLYAISDAIALHFSTTKQMTLWASGGLVGVTKHEILIILPLIILGVILAIINSKKLSILSLDEEIALSLGVDVKKLKILFFFLVILLTASAISLSGSMVFIGLIVPHLVRKIVGGDYKHIVLFSMIVGPTFMMITDLISRVIHAPYETPISAVMAIVSYPLFIYVAKKGTSS